MELEAQRGIAQQRESAQQMRCVALAARRGESPPGGVTRRHSHRMRLTGFTVGWVFGTAMGLPCQSVLRSFLLALAE